MVLSQPWEGISYPQAITISRGLFTTLRKSRWDIHQYIHLLIPITAFTSKDSCTHTLSHNPETLNASLLPLHTYASTLAVLAPVVFLGPPLTVPGRLSVYLANALARALLQLTFWLPMKDSTVTAMARSISCELQYSQSRILEKDSAMRIMASRWRTFCFFSTS